MMGRRISPIGNLKIAILQFPGSNCDQDCFKALTQGFGVNCFFHWHEDRLLPPSDAVIIPGGFSYGDYLRSGALAAHSPAVDALRGFIEKGGAALGICNGFQILTESKLLPGALLRNSACKFICQQQVLKIQSSKFFPEPNANETSLISIPIAHGEGRYFLPEQQRKKLWEKACVAFTYHGSNPNGSDDAIAGICSENGRVIGMMPHPERSMDKRLTTRSEDGRLVLKRFLEIL